MNLKRRRRSSFQDSSASSDIAFLLIIYFIVIAGFNINKGFLMTLPQKDSARLILKDELMRFELDEQGALWYQGGMMDWRNAERVIRATISRYPNMAVVLTIEPQAPWQQVVSFVELAQKLEVESFSFSMKDIARGPYED